MPITILLRRAALCPLLLLALCGGSPARAAAPSMPILSPLFTDNMVLQRGIPDSIWGWTTPGQGVGVNFAGKTITAIAGADGKWMAKIGPLPAGGPYTLTILQQYPTGPSVPGFRQTFGAIYLKNVMVGDVWLCAGQSNMEFGVGNVASPEPIIAAAGDPNLRLFTVNKVTAAAPQALTSGQWQACTPETVKSQGTWNGFSAVAYFFGQKLRRDTKVPIGLMLSSWGGTPAESWVSEGALRKNVPEFAPQMDQLDAAQLRTPDFTRSVADWYAKNDPGTPAQWQDPAADDAGWETITAPSLFEDAGLADLKGVDGVVWYRKTFDLPAGSAGKDAVLHLMVDDSDTTWVNGKQVGATDGYNVTRAYALPASLLKPTGNVVAVRVLDTGGGGGIWGEPSGLNLSVTGGEILPLAGPWRIKLGVLLSKTTPLPTPIAGNPNFPATLYNGQINPLVPFGIKGAIWYQGETNAGRDAQYRRLLPALIGDWRAQWNEGAFPFLIVQLAGYQPGGDAWPLLREAQWRTTLSVPNTGLATAIDIGDPTDIHPKNKQDVGQRLALVAEAKFYGLRVPYAGPVYKALAVSGHTATLTFTHTEGSLVSRSGLALTGFEIAGTDGVFVPAAAHLSGNTVAASSAKVPVPTAVRYAWSGYPQCSLYNGAGLPAFPFDTSGK